MLQAGPAKALLRRGEGGEEATERCLPAEAPQGGSAFTGNRIRSSPSSLLHNSP